MEALTDIRHHCELCDRSFPLRKTLYRHVRTVHQQAESLKCPHPGCTTRFVRQDIRDRHAVTQHGSGTKTIQCPDCDKEIRPRALAEHRTTKTCQKQQVRSDDARILHLKAVAAASPSVAMSLHPQYDPLLVVTYLFLELGDLGSPEQSSYETKCTARDPPVDILRLRGLAYRTLSRSLKDRSPQQCKDIELYHAISLITTIDCILEGVSALDRHVPALRSFGQQQYMVSLPVLRESIDHFSRDHEPPPDAPSLELSAVLAQQLSGQIWTKDEVPNNSTMLYSQLWSAKSSWWERVRPVRSIIWVVKNYENDVEPIRSCSSDYPALGVSTGLSNYG